VWSMSQFHRLFNGCKTPGETVDTLNHYFKTGTVLLLYLCFFCVNAQVSRACIFTIFIAFNIRIFAE